MPILFAGLASATFGVSDFLGGLATRKAPAASVVVSSQLAGLVLLLAAAPLAGGSATATDLWWGAAAGTAGGAAIGVFYHAIATTRVGVAAPVGAVAATVLQVLFGLVVGERPASIAWAGIAIAIPAIVLITAGGDRSHAGRAITRRAFVLGVITGVGFALFGICISRTGDAAGLWPLLGARGASIVLMTGIALGTGRPLLVGPGVATLAVIVGLGDMAGNIFFLVAVRRGLLSLVSVIVSLYPAATVLLARTVLGERVAAVQAAGLALAALGVTLIALG
jgi:drug/metabolite transporter (DMT)-like permease